MNHEIHILEDNQNRDQICKNNFFKFEKDRLDLLYRSIDTQFFRKMASPGGWSLDFSLFLQSENSGKIKEFEDPIPKVTEPEEVAKSMEENAK